MLDVWNCEKWRRFDEVYKGKDSENGKITGFRGYGLNKIWESGLAKKRVFSSLDEVGLSRFHHPDYRFMLTVANMGIGSVVGSFAGGIGGYALSQENPVLMTLAGIVGGFVFGGTALAAAGNILVYSSVDICHVVKGKRNIN